MSRETTTDTTQASQDSLGLDLPSLADTQVIVLGDVMLDRYWHGRVERISQEAPVPVVSVREQDDRPGGAANVALNVVALGARCVLLGAVANDEAGRVLRSRLAGAGVVIDFAEAASTTMKLRMVDQGRQLIRADFDSDASSAAGELSVRLATQLASADVLVLEDYDKGALVEPEAVIAQARAAGVPVVVDPKHKPLQRFAGAAVVKPNEAEFVAATGFSPATDEGQRAAEALLREHDLGALVVTRGNKGMVVFEPGRRTRLPAQSVDVFDVTGAGDTAAAALALGLALGRSVVDSARLANVASSVAVSRSGTVSVSGPELAAALRSAQPGVVVSRRGLLELVADARRHGRRIVFTNGCFDILHAGHVGYLEEARQLGDLLIVAVNEDESVTRLKGEGRPVNTIERRLKVLSGLACVDLAVGFAEDTPQTLLEAVRPDVLVKGGDYSEDEVVGADFVRSIGGEVRVLSEIDDCSTTQIVQQLKQER